MKRLALATALALTTVLIAQPAAAQGNTKPKTDGLSIPVTGASTGGTFTGIFQLQKFVAQQNDVLATGLLTGTVKMADGTAASVVRTVSMPVTVGQAAGTTAPLTQAVATQASCGILHLELGPISLDLLGLQVDLNQVVLDVAAGPGSGNLLGNLLCSVTGLLDNSIGLATLLNQILAAL